MLEKSTCFCYLLGIHSLKSVSVTSRKVTVSWIICGNFTQHSISYESIGGDYLYKNLPYDGKSEYVERIVKLDPCTQYTIIVNMTNNHSTSQQSINIITLPGGSFTSIFITVCLIKCKGNLRRNGGIL